MWPFFLARKQLFPPRRFPVFAFVSILGVACGVTALLVVQTVMNSFGEEHRQRIREAVGDVIVESRYQYFTGVSDFEKILNKDPRITASAVAIEGGVAWQTNKGTPNSKALPFFGVRGINVEEELKVSPWEKYVRTGDIKKLDDDRIALGSLLASNMDVRVGDFITVISGTKAKQMMDTAMSGSSIEKVSLPRELEVCAIIHTGFKDADEGTAFVTLRMAREIFEIPKDSATKVRLKLSDPEEADSVAFSLNTQLDDAFYARPWTSVNRAFIDAIAMEKHMLFLLMFIITVVASFSIGSTLFSHVVRRTREIGLIGALGGTPAQVMKLFLSQGFLIGTCGYILGLFSTFIILYFRQNIVSLMGADDTLLNQYKFDTVPLHYATGDFIKAAILTIILMTLASLIPAIWAARRKPSEAMRDVV